MEGVPDEEVVHRRRLLRRRHSHRPKEVHQRGVRAEAVDLHLHLQRHVAPPSVTQAARLLERRQLRLHALDQLLRARRAVAYQRTEHLGELKRAARVAPRRVGQRTWRAAYLFPSPSRATRIIYCTHAHTPH
eukprot:scaffold4324_cov57-Phaeocystis_antarctica.AAC.8